MAGIRFDQIQQSILSENENVVKVTSKSITYTDAFKLKAINEYVLGKEPAKIFREAGFDLNIIGYYNPKRCIYRWRNLYMLSGESSLIGEKRGRSNSEKKLVTEMSIDEKLAIAESKIAYLEMENDFLKKLEKLERRNATKQK